MAATIIQRVQDRLPFIPTDNSEDALIDRLRDEVFHSLKVPFEKKDLTDLEIEDEANYSSDQLSLTADITSCYMIFRKTVANVGGIGGVAPAGAKFLKKAKAGSAEAEFAQAKASDGGFLGMDTSKLLTWLKKEAYRKARALGFVLDICEDCSLAFEVFNDPVNTFKFHDLSGC